MENVLFGEADREPDRDALVIAFFRCGSQPSSVLDVANVATASAAEQKGT